jgi:hypothetical protein
LVLAVTALIPVPTDAQVMGVTLSGTITYTSGAVIPRAEIRIADVATAVSRVVTTNADGLSFPLAA